MLRGKARDRGEEKARERGDGRFRLEDYTINIRGW